MSNNPPKSGLSVTAVIVIASAVLVVLAGVIIALVIALTSQQGPAQSGRDKDEDEDDEPKSSEIVLDATWGDGTTLSGSELQETKDVIIARLEKENITSSGFEVDGDQIRITFDDDVDEETLDEAAELLEVTFNADFRPVLEIGECDPSEEYTDSGPDDEVTLCDRYEFENFLLGPSEVAGDTIIGATTFRQDTGGYWGVKIVFDPSGSAALADLTERLFTAGEGLNKVAIVLDGEVLSSPTVTEAIMDGVVSITGNYTESEIDELAAQLRFASQGLELSVDDTVYVK